MRKFHSEKEIREKWSRLRSKRVGVLWYDRRNAGPFLKVFAFPASGGEGIPLMVPRFLWDGAHCRPSAAGRPVSFRTLAPGLRYFALWEIRPVRPGGTPSCPSDDDALAGELLTPKVSSMDSTFRSLTLTPPCCTRRRASPLLAHQTAADHQGSEC